MFLLTYSPYIQGNRFSVYVNYNAEIGLDEFPSKYKDRIDIINDNQRRLDAHYIFNQSKSLLAIKHPYTGDAKDLEINEKKTQLFLNRFVFYK